MLAALAAALTIGSAVIAGARHCAAGPLVAGGRAAARAVALCRVAALVGTATIAWSESLWPFAARATFFGVEGLLQPLLPACRAIRNG